MGYFTFTAEVARGGTGDLVAREIRTSSVMYVRTVYVIRTTTPEGTRSECTGLYGLSGGTCRHTPTTGQHERELQ